MIHAIRTLATRGGGKHLQIMMPSGQRSGETFMQIKHPIQQGGPFSNPNFSTFSALNPLPKIPASMQSKYSTKKQCKIVTNGSLFHHRLMHSFSKLKQTQAKKLLFVGGAIWQGQNIRGVEQTPDLLRQANLFQSLREKYAIDCIDLGNISGRDYTPPSEDNHQQASHHIRNLQLLDSLLLKINDKIVEGAKSHPDSVVVTIGGDHSVGTATLHALNSHYKDLKVIWVDAHPDFIHPQQSSYQNYHGYPVAHVTGLASSIPGFMWLTERVPYENIVLIGIRDIDKDEWVNLKKHKVKCFTMDHVVQLGIGQVMQQAIEYLDPAGDKPFHISFDIDALDPHVAFGTGTKFRGGLSPMEGNHIVRAVAHQRRLVGLDVMEINKELELQETRLSFRGESRNGLVTPTVGLGIDLIESIFTEYFTL